MEIAEPSIEQAIGRVYFVLFDTMKKCTPQDMPPRLFAPICGCNRYLVFPLHATGTFYLQCVPCNPQVLVWKLGQLKW